jgi:1-acyl-sn-glycerol-3-phosphate acyltransferase
VIFIRSLIFNALFYLNLVLFLVLGSFHFLLPRPYAMEALKAWARASVWLLQVVCGTKMEVRGAEHIPEGAAIVAGKHQSFWETFALLPLLDDPCVVLKKELTYIPLFGWFALKFRMIAVERSAGASALRRLVSRAVEETKAGRQIFIMPEGTRAAPDAPPDYKPGAAAIYAALSCPCVPFGLNSGLFWPRRKFIRMPGTITVEFMPAIPPGLPRKVFQERLERDIEASTSRLVAEARSAQSRNKIST